MHDGYWHTSSSKYLVQPSLQISFKAEAPDEIKLYKKTIQENLSRKVSWMAGLHCNTASSIQEYCLPDHKKTFVEAYDIFTVA